MGRPHRSELEIKLGKALRSLGKAFPLAEVVEGPSRVLMVANGGPSVVGSLEEAESALGAFGPCRLFARPDSPFLFAHFRDEAAASEALSGLHGTTLPSASQPPPPLLLAFLAAVPLPPPGEQAPPPGLRLVPDAVSQEEEAALWALLKDRPTTHLGKRQVLHFGFNWDYSRSRIQEGEPRPEPMPEPVQAVLRRLEAAQGLAEAMDQCTVNVYEAGAGIPAHTDAHVSCGEELWSLSLLSPVLMDFRQPLSGESAQVELPPRSLLCLSGQARYVWTHAIAARRWDFLPGGLAQPRRLRLSLTFRRRRPPGPCPCAQPLLCNEPSTQPLPAPLLESRYVAEVYERIAEDFSSTREKEWAGVGGWLDSLAPASVVVDVGCGNGKYLGHRPGLVGLGVERSLGLCSAARRRTGAEVVRGCGLSLPLRSESADAVLSVAVVHHMASEERRRVAVGELLRVARPGAPVLVLVWAFEQRRHGQPSAYLQQGNSPSPAAQARCLSEDAEKTKERPKSSLPVHENRTEFEEQDLLVPWDKTDKAAVEDKQRFLRFYHVFREGELESLAQGLPCDVERSWYEQGNWAVVLRKHKP